MKEFKNVDKDSIQKIISLWLDHLSNQSFDVIVFDKTGISFIAKKEPPRGSFNIKAFRDIFKHKSIPSVKPINEQVEELLRIMNDPEVIAEIEKIADRKFFDVFKFKIYTILHNYELISKSSALKLIKKYQEIYKDPSKLIQIAEEYNIKLPENKRSKKKKSRKRIKTTVRYLRNIGLKYKKLKNFKK